MSEAAAEQEAEWRDDGRVRVAGMRAKVSHVKRVEERGGREEVLVALATREGGEMVREEGMEVWVELRLCDLRQGGRHGREHRPELGMANAAPSLHRTRHRARQEPGCLQ